MAAAVASHNEVASPIVMVPHYKDLAAVYSAVADAEARYQQLTDKFVELYGEKPEVYARAPGRVNLIGEHIDYEGYGVLPMAIQQDTVVAIRKGGSNLRVANLEEKYPLTEFDTDPNQEVDVANHSWANYFLSAYKGVYENLEAKALKVPDPIGLQVMIHGVVPTGAGVSSSAAMVCSCALAVLAVHGIELSKAEVAEFACKAEQHVGVTSGGMDQAISMMGMTGSAMNVEFNPVRAFPVTLPPGAVFVIANSLTVSNKAETAPYRYNMRVVECRLAAAVLAAALGMPRSQAAAVQTLREVEPLVAAQYSGDGHLERAVGEKLHLDPYTQEEVEELLGVKLQDMFSHSAASMKVLAVAGGVGGFRLLQRALHVFSEAQRVRSFREVCEGSAPVEEQLSQLGALMDASHESCARLYNCSCAELDKLVGLAKDAGALGARLTGAGWGGCMVALIREGEEEGFKAQLHHNYFAPLIESGRITADDLPLVLFASKPAAGAAVLQLSL